MSTAYVVVWRAWHCGQWSGATACLARCLEMLECQTPGSAERAEAVPVTPSGLWSHVTSLRHRLRRTLPLYAHLLYLRINLKLGYVVISHSKVAVQSLQASYCYSQ